MTTSFWLAFMLWWPCYYFRPPLRVRWVFVAAMLAILIYATVTYHYPND